MVVNIKGSILNQIFAAVEKNPKLTMGELIHLALKPLKKHYAEASDEEIYASFEKFAKLKEEDDEPMNEKDFENWREKAVISK